MKRAYSATDIINMKKEILPFTGSWYDAFGTPERYGTWIIWGNSANGKSSFVMQLCKELTKFGKVAYNSLEEGAGLTMQETLLRHDMASVSRRFFLLDCEPISDLSERLSRRKSPDFVVIDSFQYTQMSYKDYIDFKEKHRDKLLIFVSHADGKNPDGRSAKKVRYDASLKVYVNGFRAFSLGRFIGPVGHYDIWPEKATELFGE